MTLPALTIVVPTRDRPEQLRRCLASITAAMRDGDELLVVDSASRQPVRTDAAVVRLEQPGVNRARNAGWRRAKHELIAYVDDDAVVDPSWADAFARAADAHPEAAFFTGRLSALGDGDVAVKDDAAPAVLDRASRGDLGHGANMLVRAAALNVIGGWDESLGAGGRFRSAPEADVFDRLFLAGFVGRFEPSARAWHDQWRSARELIQLDWRYGFGNGARLSKLARTDRQRFGLVAGEALWEWGLEHLGAALRRRNKTDAGRVTARLAGTAAGFVRASFSRVSNGHFVERGKPRSTL